MLRDVITTCMKYLHKMKALSQDMLGKIKYVSGPAFRQDYALTQVFNIRHSSLYVMDTNRAIFKHI